MDQQVTSAIALHALESAPVGIAIVDNGRTIQFINARLQTLFALENKTMQGQSVDSLPNAFREVLNETEATIELPTTADGNTLHLKCQSRAYGEGRNAGTIYFVTDVTEQMHATHDRDDLASQLSRLTTRDPVTGLPNRQALLQGLEPLVSRSRRYNNPLSVVRLRINELDELDRAHGEDSGEQAVVKVSHLLRDQMRWADLVGRLDDNEFLLILPETSGDDAKTLASKLEAQIAELRVEHNGDTFSVTPRFGVAQWEKGDDANLLLKGALKSMQEAHGAAA
jgi:diguanylate cyclase (GGDEF)-like protein